MRRGEDVPGVLRFQVMLLQREQLAGGHAQHVAFAVDGFVFAVQLVQADIGIGIAMRQLKIIARIAIDFTLRQAVPLFIAELGDQVDFGFLEVVIIEHISARFDLVGRVPLENIVSPLLPGIALGMKRDDVIARNALISADRVAEHQGMLILGMREAIKNCPRIPSGG